MKGKCIVILAVFLFIVSFFSIGAWGANWKYYFKNSEGNSWFYDTQSVSRGQDTTKVQVKSTPSDKVKARFIKKSYNDGIKKFIYSLTRIEINCSKNEQSEISEMGYSSEGTMIYEINEIDQFKVEAPNTNGSVLYKAICR